MAGISQLLVYVISAGLLACIYPFPPFSNRKRAARFVAGAFVALVVVAPKVQPRPIEPPEMAAAPSADWATTIIPTPSGTLPVRKAAPTIGPETPIRRSSPGDRGRYFLISAVKSSGVVKALHKRVGVDSVGWTRTEIDCKAHRIRDIGYSEDGPDKITSDPTRWYELVPGSSNTVAQKF